MVSFERTGDLDRAAESVIRLAGAQLVVGPSVFFSCTRVCGEPESDGVPESSAVGEAPVSVLSAASLSLSEQAKIPVKKSIEVKVMVVPLRLMPALLRWCAGTQSGRPSRRHSVRKEEGVLVVDEVFEVVEATVVKEERLIPDVHQGRRLEDPDARSGRGSKARISPTMSSSPSARSPASSNSSDPRALGRWRRRADRESHPTALGRCQCRTASA